MSESRQRRYDELTNQYSILADASRSALNIGDVEAFNQITKMQKENRQQMADLNEESRNENSKFLSSKNNFNSYSNNFKFNSGEGRSAQKAVGNSNYFNIPPSAGPALLGGMSLLLWFF